MNWAFAILMLVPGQAEAKAPKVAVGSKVFTESVILGEMATLLARHAGLRVKHNTLGGTQILWQALRQGEIDVYPEYTGTISQEILAGREITDRRRMEAALAEYGIRMTSPLGFNNTYAIGMQKHVARRLGIRKISDLRRHPQLRFGFGNEFLDRAEGWPSLSQRYRLPQRNVKGLEHTLCYRALVTGDIQAMDIYSTDAEVRLYELRVLEDDLRHFPAYDAVFLYRQNLEETAPEWVKSFRKLEAAIDESEIMDLNARVQVGRDSEQRVAAQFLKAELGITVAVIEQGLAGRLWERTLEHLLLVVVSLSWAILVAVPLGVVAVKKPRTGHVILSIAEIIQTIPGLALLVLLMPIVAGVGLRALGPAPAIVALFMYSLLPILRNTYAGISNIPHTVRESATVLGLTPRAQLLLIELPIASRMILAGIKTTAAINVGYATLGGLVGAGGYGQTIITGLRLYDERLMLEGAIPAALMALAFKMLFEWGERWLVPKGLRLKETPS